MDLINLKRLSYLEVIDSYKDKIPVKKHLNQKKLISKIKKIIHVSSRHHSGTPHSRGHRLPGRILQLKENYSMW